VRVAVPKTLADQTLLNTAAVHGDQGDPLLANDSASASTLVGPAVDLRVSKTTAGAVAGGDVTWTIAVENAGPSAASAVTLTDALPPGTTFASALAGQGSCTAASGIVTCALGALPVHGAAQVAITAHVAGGLAGAPLRNTASAASPEPEIEPADNEATVTTTVRAPTPTSPTLVVTKTAGTTTPRLGVPFDYVIRVRNTGAVDAPGVVVTDALAAALRLQSATPSAGTCEGERVVTCALGLIPAGAEGTVVVRVVPVGAGQIANFASADSSLSTRVDGGALGATARVRVRAPGTRIALRKTVARQVVRAGDRVTFTLTVRGGARAARDVTLCDALPAGMSLARAGGATLRRGKPCWHWGFLAAHGKRTVRVTVRVAPGARGGALRNRARATAGNAGTRLASATIQVRARAPRGGGVTG
jgi:uncharacterized repeat protein (TIGR01451 family)